MAERLVLACLLLHMAFIYVRLGVFSTSRSMYSKHSTSVFRLFVIDPGCSMSFDVSIMRVLRLDVRKCATQWI